MSSIHRHSCNPVPASPPLSVTIDSTPLSNPRHSCSSSGNTSSLNTLLRLHRCVPSSSSSHLLFSSAACLFILLVHGILSCTLLWRCSSSQSFATSHGLFGFSPTCCPSASCRPSGCIYPADSHLSVTHSQQVLLPESLRSFSILIPRLHALLVLTLHLFTLRRSSCFFAPLLSRLLCTPVVFGLLHCHPDSLGCSTITLPWCGTFIFFLSLPRITQALLPRITQAQFLVCLGIVVV